MIKVQPLGSATWGNSGQMLHFTSDNRLIAVGFEGGLQIFDIQTGLPERLWDNENEDLGVFAALENDQFLVGGSFGILYTLERRNNKFEIVEERDLLPYFDCLAFSRSRNLIAVSCFDNLSLLPVRGKVNPIYVQFNRERIQSINWVDSLDSFFTVTSKSISLVSPAGERTIVASFKERVLAAAYVDLGSRLISFVEARENEGTLVCASMANPGKADWEKIFVVDDAFVGPTTNDHREGAIVISETNKTILLGINQWVRRLNLDGKELGEPKRLFQHICGFAVSPDEHYFAAGSGWTVLSCWDEDGTAVMERTCHSGRVAEIEFSTDDAAVFTCSNDPEYCCWDVVTGRKNWSRRFEGTTSAGMLLSPPAELIVSVWKGGAHRSDVSEIFLLDSLTGTDRPMFSVSHRRPTKIFRNNDSIFTICDGDFLGDGVIEQRNIDTGKIQSTFVGGNSELSHVCAQGDRLAGTDENHTWLWNVLNSSKRSDFPLPDDSKIRGLYFADDAHLISITERGAFRLDIKKARWKQIVSFESNILACSQPTNGRMVLCAKGGNVEIRSPENVRLIEQLEIIHEHSDISACGISHSGTKLVTGAHDGTLILTSLD